MYKVKIANKQEVCTQKAKSVLPSTELKDDTSVRSPSNRGSSSKNSILLNTKNHSEDVEVYDVSCVSCDKNVLTPCHDKCLAKYKLYANSNVRRALFTPPRTAKSKSVDTTPVVTKNSRANVVIQIVFWIVDSGCSKHMTGDLRILKKFIEKFIGTVRFGNDHFATITGYGDYLHGNITICHVYYVEGLGHNLFSVGKFFDVEDTSIPSKEDLDNLFGPMYEEYSKKRTPEMSINSATQLNPNNEEPPLSSSTIVEDQEAPSIVSSFEEQITPFSTDDVVESVQEDSAEFDRNTLFTPYDALTFEEA
ncbi:hypothetical protein Tco_0379028 [Tanacetum coccineum]